MSLRLLPRRLLLKHQLLPLVQLSQAEPLRANLHVMRLARLLVPLLHDPTRHVQIRRVLRLPVAHPVQPLLAVRLVRRLVAR